MTRLKIDTPPMTVACDTEPKHDYWKAFAYSPIDNDESLASPKKQTQSRSRVQKPCPI